MQIPYLQIQGDMDAMGVERLHCMQGLGDFSLTAPGGFFSSWDVSQWGLLEWGTAAFVAYGLINLVSDTRTISKRVRTSSRKRTRKRKALEEARAL